jgi:imidazolonepropionase-like amidohydrolase
MSASRLESHELSSASDRRRERLSVPIPSVVWILSLLPLLAQHHPHALAQADAATIYKGATLIDGTGRAAISNVSILVRGERIEAIAPASELAAPAGSKMVDVRGLYVLPGLINTHVHLATDSTRKEALQLMRRDLYSGVTAERDMAGDTRQLAELARASILDEVAGPDIYYAALMAGPSFFKDKRTHDAARGAVAGEVPWMKAVTSQTDLHLAVAEARGTGATAIKIYADLSPDLVAAITREAHSQGMLVWAHATVYPATAMQTVEAGVDSVSHAPMLAITNPANTYAEAHLHPAAEQQYADGLGPRLNGLLEEMKRRDTILDATLVVFKVNEDGRLIHSEAHAVNTLDIGERVTHAAYEAGVPISTGTDTEDEANKDRSPLVDEMVLLQNGAGMQPADVIHSATEVGARTLGQEKEMGTVEPGKLANLVFVSRNPLDGVQAFNDVLLTVKRGNPYWRKDYALGEKKDPQKNKKLMWLE